jgi:hypothetical protein
MNCRPTPSTPSGIPPVRRRRRAELLAVSESRPAPVGPFRVNAPECVLDWTVCGDTLFHGYSMAGDPDGGAAEGGAPGPCRRGGERKPCVYEQEGGAAAARDAFAPTSPAPAPAATSASAPAAISTSALRHPHPRHSRPSCSRGVLLSACTAVGSASRVEKEDVTEGVIRRWQRRMLIAPRRARPGGGGASPAQKHANSWRFYRCSSSVHSFRMCPAAVSAGGLQRRFTRRRTCARGSWGCRGGRRMRRRSRRSARRRRCSGTRTARAAR